MRLSGSMLALAVPLVLAGNALAAQCALCSESIASARKAGAGDPALGFSIGVLVLLGVLAVLAAGFVAMVLFAARGENGPTEGT